MNAFKRASLKLRNMPSGNVIKTLFVFKWQSYQSAKGHQFTLFESQKILHCVVFIEY